MDNNEEDDSDATEYGGDMDMEETPDERTGDADLHGPRSGSETNCDNIFEQTKDTKETTNCQTSGNQNLDVSDDGDDGSVCPICMDLWSNSGSHRLISLRCGHLFGHSCIDRWLQVSCQPGQRRCPQCNKKASLKDIRFLYARKLQVLDTAEKDRLKQQVEELQLEKNKLVLELAQAKLNQELHLKKIVELKQKYEELLSSKSQNMLHSTGLSASRLHSSQITTRISLDRNIEISKNGGCRVSAFSEWHKLLVVSQSSTNSLFSGFGIRKIDALDFRPGSYHHLHTKPIRDLAFHPERKELLLSVSLDRSAKLVDVTSNTSVHTYTTDSSLWSCCWDFNNSNMLFVGSQNGIVTEFDLRQTSQAICQLSVPGDTSPVTSLAPFPSRANRTLPRGGVLACRLNSCCAYHQNGENFSVEQLALTGPFTSLSYETRTDHVLVSTRPNARVPNSCHVLCKFESVGAETVCSPVHTFIGSNTQKLLSRPCIVPAHKDMLVAAHIESSKIIAVWSVSSGQRLLSLPTTEPVIDISALQVNDSLYLAALSEKSLRLYELK